MPVRFQKPIGRILEIITSKFAFPDDIFVITKRTINEHEQESERIFEKPDKEGLALKLQKCDFAKNTIEWLGFEMTLNESLH